MVSDFWRTRKNLPCLGYRQGYRSEFLEWHWRYLLKWSSGNRDNIGDNISDLRMTNFSTVQLSKKYKCSHIVYTPLEPPPIGNPTSSGNTKLVPPGAHPNMIDEHSESELPSGEAPSPEHSWGVSWSLQYSFFSPHTWSYIKFSTTATIRWIES